MRGYACTVNALNPSRPPAPAPAPAHRYAEVTERLAPADKPTPAPDRDVEAGGADQEGAAPSAAGLLELDTRFLNF